MKQAQKKNDQLEELSPLELSAPQIDIFQAAARRILLQMGQGGGKTLSLGVTAYFFASRIPNALGLIAANTFKQLSDSTLLELFTTWKKYFGWTEWNRENPDGYYVIDKAPPPEFVKHNYTFKTNEGKIFLKNGVVIMTVALENYKALEGRTIGWALLDETSDTREVAVKEVIVSRLRQTEVYVRKKFNLIDDIFPYVAKDHPMAAKTINPLFIFTKPAKEQWLTEFFNLEKFREEIIISCKSETDYFSKHDVEGSRVIVIASAYHNKENLPEGYIDQRASEYTEDQKDLLIYGSPFGKSGNEYYAAFKRDMHVKPVQYHNGCPLHISFDFNVNPYMTAKVWICVSDSQDNRLKWRALKEYAMKAPNNTIEATCRKIISDYRVIMKRYGIFIYGDASGKNSIPVESVKNYYVVIERMFADYLSRSWYRVLKQNMRHRSVGEGTIGRRDLMNKSFLGGYGFDIEIDPSCILTIKDYEFIREDKNGAKLKVKKKINGIECEELGHMSDADDAIFCYHYGE